VSLQRELRLYHRIDVPQSRSAGSACSAKPCRGRIKCTDESARWDEQANSATAPMCTCPLKQQQEGATKALKLKCMIESSQTTPSVRSKKNDRGCGARRSEPRCRPIAIKGNRDRKRSGCAGRAWDGRTESRTRSDPAQQILQSQHQRFCATSQRRNDTLHTSRSNPHSLVHAGKQNGGKVCNWNGCVIPDVGTR
jgi:hypothetical protein